jgi:hypothetical protein
MEWFLIAFAALAIIDIAIAALAIIDLLTVAFGPIRGTGFRR